MVQPIFLHKCQHSCTVQASSDGPLSSLSMHTDGVVHTGEQLVSWCQVGDPALMKTPLGCVGGLTYYYPAPLRHCGSQPGRQAQFQQSSTGSPLMGNVFCFGPCAAGEGDPATPCVWRGPHSGQWRWEPNCHRIPCHCSIRYTQTYSYWACTSECIMGDFVGCIERTQESCSTYNILKKRVLKP